MHGNPCLASSGELLVRLLPAGLVSEPSALLCPSQLCEYRSDLYLGEETHELHRTGCGLIHTHFSNDLPQLPTLLSFQQYVWYFLKRFNLKT